MHYGRAQETLDARHRVMSKAATLHPERFVHGLPKLIETPSTVWINPPGKNIALQDALQPAISLSAIPWAGPLEAITTLSTLTLPDQPNLTPASH